MHPPQKILATCLMMIHNWRYGGFCTCRLIVRVVFDNNWVRIHGLEGFYIVMSNDFYFTSFVIEQFWYLSLVQHFLSEWWCLLRMYISIQTMFIVGKTWGGGRCILFLGEITSCVEYAPQFHKVHPGGVNSTQYPMIWYWHHDNSVLFKV